MITITKETGSETDTIMVGVVEGRFVYTLNSGQESCQESINMAREVAKNQMIQEAQKKGADAIVCVRYSSAPDENGATEVTAYGTAVKYRKL